MLGSTVLVVQRTKVHIFLLDLPVVIRESNISRVTTGSRTGSNTGNIKVDTIKVDYVSAYRMALSNKVHCMSIVECVLPDILNKIPVELHTDLLAKFEM